MGEQGQIVYRDAFLGRILENRRALEPIRFPMVVSFFQSGSGIPVSTFRNLLQAVYCSRGKVNIISCTDSKMMIMFSDDQEAVLAYQELHNRTIEDHSGPIVSFKIWHPMDDLGYDVADHHIYIVISGLPLHLWKKDVVEQILHPYCALGHLSEETIARRNLSSYTAFGWSQKRIAMPRRISLKVTKQVSASLKETPQFKEVAVYQLMVDAAGFLCDETTECSCNLENINNRYEAAYDPDSAQCFLTETPDNQDILEELDYTVLATASHQDHGCQKEELQDMISSYLSSFVKVHMINSTQFIILTNKVRQQKKYYLK